MKKMIVSAAILGAAICCATAARAEVPDLIPVQGILTDQYGDTIDGLANIQFAIYDSEVGGTLVWSELYNGVNQVDVVDGFFTVYLGTLTTINFEDFVLHPELWLGITVGLDDEMDRIRMAAVPFAEEAGICSQVGDLTAEDIQEALNFACSGDQFLRGWDPVSGPICGTDITSAGVDGGTITDVYAGTGLQKDWVSGNPELSAVFGTAAGTVAEGNHLHAGTYQPLTSGGPCGAGSFISNIDPGTGAVTCTAEETGESYTAGFGLTAAVVGSNIEFAVNDTLIQVRLDGSCAPGEFVESINPATGDFACATPAGSDYTPGTGITIGSGQISVDFGVVQHRVYTSSTTINGQCDDGNLVRGIDPASGAITCVVDQTTTGEPGTGIVSLTALPPLTGGGNDVNETIGIDMGTGAAQAAWGNHNHDAVYPQVSETLAGMTCAAGQLLEYDLSLGWICAADDDTNTNAATLCSGDSTYLDGEGNCDVINLAGFQLDVVATTCALGIASIANDGTVTCSSTDANTIYTAGAGIGIASDVISVAFAGSGTAATASRSDHGHDHGTLAGQLDDDHPQYFNLSQAETVSAIPAFNGGTSGTSAPFTVDSSTLVTNLNADLFDGLDSTDFSMAGHTHTGYAPTSHSHAATDITSGTLSTDRFDAYADLTAAGVLNADADTDILIRSQSDARYAATSHAHDHGGMTGLLDDDHTQYFNLAQAETVSAIPAFTGGTTGTSAPFTVDSTFLVTNMNADLIDGQHATDFAAAGHTHTEYAPTSHSHDHGAMTGLADDDHTQYFNLAQAEAVTAIPSFNGGTSGVSAPFTVDSNFAVTSLNADLLDGLHASAFTQTGHTHVWSNITDPPAVYPNSNLLDGLDSTAFSLAAHNHTGVYLPLFSCTLGQVMKWDGSAWACDADLGGTYIAGDGIGIASNTISVDWAEVQHRVYTDATTDDGICDTGYVVRGVNPDTGEVICVLDATVGGTPGTGIIQVNAISPITGGGNTSTIDIGVSVGTAAGTVAAGNHAHAGVYAPVSHAHSGADITSGTVGTSYYSAYADLTAEAYLNNDADTDILTRAQCDARYPSLSHTHDHGTNTGLADDDHPQYFNLSQSETVAGIPAFTGGTTGSTAPFSVDSTFLVTSLNADLIDGQHASEFATTSHAHDHGAMTGLADDDHTQYFNLSQAEAVTAIPAFNGGTTGASAPFTVDSTFLVTSLNSDLLDGQHGTYYATSAHTHAGVYAPVSHAHSGADITSGTVGTSYYSAYADLTAEAVLNNDADTDILTRLQGDARYAATSHAHDHGGMSGLADDDHTQYFNLSQAETVTAIPAFTGGTTGSTAPFTVDSTFLVTNLNSDLLDGQHGSYYSAATHGHDHGTLSGLTDDDHTQYFNLSQSETVSGRPAFNGGTSGSTAPFSVDSTLVVTSLNADYLDGLHSSSFLTNCSTCNTTFDARYILRTGDTVSTSGVYNFSYTGASPLYGTHVFANASTNTGPAWALVGRANNHPSAAGVYGDSSDGSGISSTSYQYGVYGFAESYNSNHTTGQLNGVYGAAYTEINTGSIDYAGVRGAANNGDVGISTQDFFGGYFTANTYYGNTYGIRAQATNTGGYAYGGYFVASTSTSDAYGIYASSTNNGSGSSGYDNWGMFLNSNQSNAAATGNAEALEIQSNHNGTSGGVYGVHIYTYGSNAGSQYGVSTNSYGSTGDTGAQYGVYSYINGTTTGTRYAVNGYSATAGSYAGYFQGALHITGALTKGSGSFVQPHKSDPTKEIVYNFLEGPEHAAFIRGTAFLEGGRAVIEMPEHWQQVAAAEGITVHLTPIGTWAPLYAASISAREVVIESAAGFGGDDVEFSYYILCKRDGFQAHEPIQENVHFLPNPDQSAWMFENSWSNDTLTISAIRAMMISNGTLNADGTLNRATAARLGWKVIPNEEDEAYCHEHNLPCARPEQAERQALEAHHAADRAADEKYRRQERAALKAERNRQKAVDRQLPTESSYDDLEWDSYAEGFSSAE
ncbi:MAG: hypothetical protein M0R80_14910 [Proteobacteria bacterium]|jgi:hypothetical protein|nr:hypothetical protein [Pseudomonadota bacterium]